MVILETHKRSGIMGEHTLESAGLPDSREKSLKCLLCPCPVSRPAKFNKTESCQHVTRGTGLAR